jgi:hypothetical protein
VRPYDVVTPAFDHVGPLDEDVRATCAAVMSADERLTPSDEVVSPAFDAVFLEGELV